MRQAIGAVGRFLQFMALGNKVAARCDLPGDRLATVGLREASTWRQEVTCQAIAVK